MDTNPIPQEQPVTQAPVAATPATPPPLPAATIPGAPTMVMVQLPIWKNPRMYIAAAAAILIIATGMFFSKGSGLKGSFDDFDPTQDYKIQSFTITQPKDGSLEIAYKIDKKASNLFMAITKPAADDLPENDEMIKLIALSDADLTAGEHKVVLSSDDLKASFATAGTYRFQIIAYNASDEITDFKAEKRAITLDKGAVKLVAPAK